MKSSIKLLNKEILNKRRKRNEILKIEIFIMF